MIVKTGQRDTAGHVFPVVFELQKIHEGDMEILVPFCPVVPDFTQNHSTPTVEVLTDR